jgi:hypothetical protein
MVSNEPTPSGKRARDQFQRHEHFVRDVVLAAQSKARGRDEAEPRVEPGMADHDNDSRPGFPDGVQPLTHELRPDSLALVGRPHGQWREAKNSPIVRANQRDRRKQDMTDDRTMLGDQ